MSIRTYRKILPSNEECEKVVSKKEAVKIRFNKIFGKVRDDKITKEEALYFDVGQGITEKHRGE